MTLYCRLICPGIKFGNAAEFFPKVAFFVCNLVRELHINDDIKVPVLADLACWQAVPAQTQLLTVVCAGRDTNRHAAFEGRHNQLCAQHGFPRGYVQGVIQIGAAHSKIGMRRQAYAEIKVPRPSLADTGLTHTRYADSLTFAHSWWNMDLQSLRRDLAGARIDPLQ